MDKREREREERDRSVCVLGKKEKTLLRIWKVNLGS